jgi:sugar fermentation stimulation protein A
MGARARSRIARDGAQVALRLDARITGRLQRRYRRFFADVALASGEVVTAHCPDPGALRGLLEPDAAVRLSTSSDPRRKLRHTLEMIRSSGTWVSVHPARANAIAELALDHGMLPSLAGYAERRREVTVPGGSRLDFRLAGRARDVRPCFLEVKSASWMVDGVARFPDSPTARGLRHVETLAKLLGEGARAVLLFVAQRGDCASVEPADDVDPRYGAALRAAARAGVEVLALRARVSPSRIALDGAIPVRL